MIGPGTRKQETFSFHGRSKMSDLTVHIVLHGEALCGFYKGVLPKDWPYGHIWTDIKDAKNVNCPSCKRLVEKMRKSPPKQRVSRSHEGAD